MATIYRKSRIGQAEIETRSLRLLPRLRNLLIIVDGRRDVEALQALLGYVPTDALNELLSYGLIEALPPRADLPAAAPLPAPADATPKASPSTRPAALNAAALEQLRRDAVRALNDTLGPAAETTAIRMERARTEAELRTLVERAADMIASVRGRAAGRAYAERYAVKP